MILSRIKPEEIRLMQETAILVEELINDMTPEELEKIENIVKGFVVFSGAIFIMNKILGD